MATWIKCTPLGKPDEEVYVNLDLIVSVQSRGNHTVLLYGPDVGGDMGQIVVSEPPSLILQPDPIRNA